MLLFVCWFYTFPWFCIQFSFYISQLHGFSSLFRSRMSSISLILLEWKAMLHSRTGKRLVMKCHKRTQEFTGFIPPIWGWHYYLLTPWRRVLLEKLTGLQLVKKFPGFHGTRRFITALTSVCHLSLSWASPIQSIYPHPTYWRSILILSTHLRLGLPSGLLPSGFPTKTLYIPLSSPIRATCRATRTVKCNLVHFRLSGFSAGFLADTKIPRCTECLPLRPYTPLQRNYFKISLQKHSPPHIIRTSS